jgi:hypothetical protein
MMHNQNNQNNRNNQNRLVNGYMQYQQHNQVFQNNSLLRNNPMFGRNSEQRIVNTQQSQYIQEHMKKLKQLQQMKQMKRMNELNNIIDDKKLTECVLYPTKIVKEENNNNLNDKYNERENDYMNNKEKFYHERTNKPYKHIINDATQINKFLNRKKITKDELIVHRVTRADADGVVEKFEELNNTMEKHNNELKVLYSLSKKAEHFQQFEYNNKYKYRIKYNPSDHVQMKKDKITYYKKEQRKLDNNRKRKDVMIESMMETGILNREELEKLNGINNKNIDIDKLEKSLADEFEGVDIDAVLSKHGINDLSENSDDNPKKQSEGNQKECQSFEKCVSNKLPDISQSSVTQSDKKKRRHRRSGKERESRYNDTSGDDQSKRRTRPVREKRDNDTYHKKIRRHRSEQYNIDNDSDHVKRRRSERTDIENNSYHTRRPAHRSERDNIDNDSAHTKRHRRKSERDNTDNDSDHIKRRRSYRENIDNDSDSPQRLRSERDNLDDKSDHKKRRGRRPGRLANDQRPTTNDHRRMK